MPTCSSTTAYGLDSVLNRWKGSVVRKWYDCASPGPPMALPDATVKASTLLFVGPKLREVWCVLGIRCGLGIPLLGGITWFITRWDKDLYIGKCVPSV